MITKENVQFEMALLYTSTDDIKLFDSQHKELI